jgi:hypothetical protein
MLAIDYQVQYSTVAPGAVNPVFADGDFPRLPELSTRR